MTGLEVVPNRCGQRQDTLGGADGDGVQVLARVGPTAIPSVGLPGALQAARIRSASADAAACHPAAPAPWLPPGGGRRPSRARRPASGLGRRGVRAHHRWSSQWQS
jgi:hypothetical protein